MIPNIKKTQEEINHVKELYLSGVSYNELKEITGWSVSTISKYLKDVCRSASDAQKLVFKSGKRKLTDEGRIKLSENGRNSCKKTGKYWTKPERLFKEILNEMGIGVKFPSDIKEIFNLEDDENPELFFQFPLQKYLCDYVDEKRKIIYSINGDFWHANPLLYDYNDLTKIQKHNVKQDKNKSIFIEKNGYYECVVWESEINWNVDLVKEKIRATRKLETPSALQAEAAAFDSLVAHSNWQEIVKAKWFKEDKKKTIIPKIEKTCETCGSKFFVTKSKNKRKFCKLGCVKFYSVMPEKDKLAEMLWSIPMTHIAKKYGVTDRSVKKWAKKYNLDTPGRGYWSKIGFYEI